MPDTVTNASRTIATQGSDHNAIATAPDVCKIPGGIPVPFPNFIPTKRAGAGKTTNTFIAQQPIVLDRTMIGPPSNPAHPGVLGGVKSGTYRFEAQATSYSKDVFAEKGALVRSFDRTTQNHRNTTGFVLSMLEAQKLKAQEKEAKKKCVIQTFRGECSHGRKLGWPGTKKDGDPYYLEVLEDDVVHFNTLRVDVTKEPHEPYPKCISGDHTAWSAEAIKFPNPMATRARLPESGTTTAESFDVPATLAVEEWVLTLMGYDDRKGSEEPDYKMKDQEAKELTRKEHVDQAVEKAQRDGKIGSKGVSSSPKSPGRLKRQGRIDDVTKNANKEYNKIQESRGQKARANPTQKNKLDKAAVTKAMALNVRDALLFWLWYVSAPEITVKALACGGARTAKIKVFPSREFKFSVDLQKKERAKAVITKKQQQGRTDRREARSAQRLQSMQRLNKAEAHFKVIYNTLNAMRSLLKLTEKMAACAGPVMGSKLNVKFLYGLKIEAKFQYMECAELKGRFAKDKRTPAHVGRRWSVFIGSNPLIGVTGYITFPLLNLGPPGVGWLASKIIKLEIFFSGRTILNVGGTVGRNEYDYCTHSGAKVTGNLRFEAGLAIGIGKWKAIEVKLVFDCGFDGMVCLWKDDPDCLIGARMGGHIEGSVDVVVFPDSWFWRKELVNWRPYWARTRFGPRRLTLLPQLN